MPLEGTTSIVKWAAKGEEVYMRKKYRSEEVDGRYAYNKEKEEQGRGQVEGDV